MGERSTTKVEVINHHREASIEQIRGKSSKNSATDDNVLVQEISGDCMVHHIKGCYEV